jgi:uncharacterized membrane protein
MQQQKASFTACKWFIKIEVFIMGYVFAFFILLAGWLTHLYVCFTEESWGFLIAGAIFFPVGFFHGVGTWFGFW